MDSILDGLYTSFTSSALTVLLASSLVAGTITQLVRDAERANRLKFKRDRSPYLRLSLRLLATLLGMLTGPPVSLGLSEIPAVMADGSKAAYAGPGFYLSMLIGFFGGLCFTLVIAAAKGHLARNPQLAGLANSLPSFDNDTDALDIKAIRSRLLVEAEVERRGIQPPSHPADGDGDVVVVVPGAEAAGDPDVDGADPPPPAEE